MEKTYRARKIVRGQAKGKALVIDGCFSFLGDVDLGNGEILVKNSPNKGVCIKDKVLISQETKGSSGGMIVLMTLKKKGLAPAAIITVKPVDYNLAEGAILTQTPFLCEPDGDLINEVTSGSLVTIDADQGMIAATLLEDE